MSHERRQAAKELLDLGYSLQMDGALDLAVDLYKRSIDLFPTAEAHAYLGWAYHFQGKLEAAIAECKKGIDIDPTLGNPYNDIGAYLIELGKPDEAIPWLEQAIASTRYDAYHYAWYNLGRAYLKKEMYTAARRCFQKSVEIDPKYQVAADALQELRYLLQ